MILLSSSSYCAMKRTVFLWLQDRSFSHPKPKSLGPSCKMDKDYWYCLDGRNTSYSSIS